MSKKKAKKALRKMADPFVVAPPGAVTIKTAIPVSADEHAKLWEIGEFLGKEYRKDLAHLLAVGGKVLITKKDKDGKQYEVLDYDRARRKQKMTAATSSRYAGTITRMAQDQYELGMRNLEQEKNYLESAIGTLQMRLAEPVRAWFRADKGEKRKATGYKNEFEWFHKRRRCENLEERLVEVDERLESGHPRMVLGGRRALVHRNNLRGKDMTDWQYERSVGRWKKEWAASRLLIAADGESGQVGGNLTIRVTKDGELSVKIPEEIERGSRLVIASKVGFSSRNRGDAWYDRVVENRAIAYQITFDVAKNKWYLHASWRSVVPDDVVVPEVEDLMFKRHLAIDLNTDHLAGWIVDGAGNAVGNPFTVPLVLEGSSETRDGLLRAAITEIIDKAQATGCVAITVENLNFEDARNVGREKMGRGRKGKKFRKTVSGIPTAKFKDRLVAMAYHARLWVIAVDPAYTSKWGEQHWKEALQEQVSSKAVITRHHCAGVAIGRRGHLLPIKRRKNGPRGKQRIVTGLPSIPGLNTEKVPHGANTSLHSRGTHKTTAKTVKAKGPRQQQTQNRSVKNELDSRTQNGTAKLIRT